MTVRMGFNMGLVCLALLGACTDENSDVFIKANILPTDDCVVDPDGIRFFSGTLDTALAQSYEPTSAYVVYPLYQNQLLNRSSVAPPRADMNGVMVTGAEVELVGPGGSPLALPGGLANPYTISAGESTFVPSTTQGQISVQTGALEIIPGQYVEALDQIVIDSDGFNMTARVTAFGVTTGGNDIEVNTWAWSIKVSRFVLVDHLSGDDLEIPGFCDAAEAPSTSLCKPIGIDQPADCRYCKLSPNPEVAACCGQRVCP